MELLITALSPVVILAFYFYYRDKYEKEPLSLLLKCMLMGALIIIPVLILENTLDDFNPFSNEANLGFAGYNAFLVAAFSEEILKLGAVYWIAWDNENFDEPFDGIVYSVFVALGFAGVENIFYVWKSGHEIAILRALTAVPAHALFGVAMGYHLSYAKFSKKFPRINLFMSFFIPFLLHGFYDFIILSREDFLILCFVPYIIYLWIRSLKRMKELIESYPIDDQEI